MPVCSVCSESKNDDEYYSYKGKLTIACKKCMIQRSNSQYIKKKDDTIPNTIYKSLSDETKSSMIEDLKYMSYKATARKYNIPYMVLYNWAKKDLYGFKKTQ